MPKETVTIVGAGLIGGSIALAARRAQLPVRLVAVDQNEPPSQELGSIFDSWIQIKDEEAVSASWGQSRLTVLCTPVSSIITLLPRVLAGAGGWVTDCGSTKKKIEQSVADHAGRQRFVPGHPMAGNPRGGLDNARADLFDGKTWIFCAEHSQSEATAWLCEFAAKLGAQPVLLSTDEHDKSVAQTSHLPQVVASALCVQAAEQDALQAAGPGYASATRVAGGADTMWRDIFESNGPPIADALCTLGEELRRLGQRLRGGSTQELLEVLAQARKVTEREP